MALTNGEKGTLNPLSKRAFSVLWQEGWNPGGAWGQDASPLGGLQGLNRTLEDCQPFLFMPLQPHWPPSYLSYPVAHSYLRSFALAVPFAWNALPPEIPQNTLLFFAQMASPHAASLKHPTSKIQTPPVSFAYFIFLQKLPTYHIICLLIFLSTSYALWGQAFAHLAHFRILSTVTWHVVGAQ